MALLAICEEKKENVHTCLVRCVVISKQKMINFVQTKMRFC